jgi:hypothetical protein
MTFILRNILWIDSIAALVAGFAVLGLLGWLSLFYNLPPNLIAAMGVVNLLYGTYSFMLARRPARARVLINALVIANATWAVFCALIALRFAQVATPFGLAHVVGEGCFVAILAAVEWTQRQRLSPV